MPSSAARPPAPPGTWISVAPTQNSPAASSTKFVVDVSFADSISSTPDEIETSGLLSFAGIEPIRVPALRLSQSHRREGARLHAEVRCLRAREHAAEGAR